MARTARTLANSTNVHERIFTIRTRPAAASLYSQFLLTPKLRHVSGTRAYSAPLIADSASVIVSPARALRRAKVVRGHPDQCATGRLPCARYHAAEPTARSCRAQRRHVPQLRRLIAISERETFSLAIQPPFGWVTDKVSGVSACTRSETRVTTLAVPNRAQTEGVKPHLDRPLRTARTRSWGSFRIHRSCDETPISPRLS